MSELFISTRKQCPPKRFSETVLGGLASDGGLYVPFQYPKIHACLGSWRTLSYRLLTEAVLGLFADIPGRTLRRVARAYNRYTFNAEDVVALEDIGNGLTALDLTRGPTLAFKDMALQPYAALAELLLERQGGVMNILGATSGDTGSAAEHAVKSKQNMMIFMLSPRRGMSSFQRAQMYALKDENVINISVNGSFDTCQDLVNALNRDRAFKEAYRLGAVNSINPARIILQVVYYIYAYLKVAKTIGDPVSFAVPTGNFGNICAGHIARMMGLPIERLILASNENDVLVDFFEGGVYRPRAQAALTSSPSMDITKASNLERFLFDLLDRDLPYHKRGVTGLLFTKLEQEGVVALPQQLVARMEARFGFVAGRSSHEDRIRTMREVHARTGIIIDPHTADGVAVAERLRAPGEQVVCLMTASYLKFPKTVREALDLQVKVPRRLAWVMQGTHRVIEIDPDLRELKRIIEAHALT